MFPVPLRETGGKAGISDEEIQDSGKKPHKLCLLHSRGQEDCRYYLGYGNRNAKQLWAGNEAEQIEKMIELWNSFDDDMKPQWLTMEQIENYASKMINK